MKLDYERLILDESPDACIVTTAASEVLHWSRAAESLFGYPAVEAITQTLPDLIVPPDLRDIEQARLEETLRTGLCTYEAVYSRRDGSRLYLDVSSKLVQGTTTSILRTYKDVTDLKLLRDVKSVEAKYRDLLESTPDAIVMVNPAGRHRARQ